MEGCRQYEASEGREEDGSFQCRMKMVCDHRPDCNDPGRMLEKLDVVVESVVKALSSNVGLPV